MAVVEAAERVRTLRIDELRTGVVPDATVVARPELETLELDGTETLQVAAAVVASDARFRPVLTVDARVCCQGEREHSQ